MLANSLDCSPAPVTCSIFLPSIDGKHRTRPKRRHHSGILLAARTSLHYIAGKRRAGPSRPIKWQSSSEVCATSLGFSLEDRRAHECSLHKLAAGLESIGSRDSRKRLTLEFVAATAPPADRPAHIYTPHLHGKLQARIVIQPRAPCNGLDNASRKAQDGNELKFKRDSGFDFVFANLSGYSVPARQTYARVCCMLADAKSNSDLDDQRARKGVN